MQTPGRDCWNIFGDNPNFDGIAAEEPGPSGALRGTRTRPPSQNGGVE